MFGTFRKHQTWLWAIIITFTVISFVWYFSPYQRMTGAHRGPVNLGSINGERISEEQYVNARNEVYLRTFFSSGRWPDEEAKKQGGQVERDIYQWLLLTQKQEQLGIYLSDDAAAQVAKGMLGSLQRAGVIPSGEVFLGQILPANGFKLDDFERFVRHYIGMQELVATVGLGGKLVTPQELRDLYKRENQEVATEAVFFSWSNYLAGVTAPPEAITQFYSNRLAVYRLPDRVQVSYVRFDLTNFQAEANQELAKMTNLDLQIEETYRREGTNFLRQVKVQSLAEAKVKLRDDERKRIEAQSARKKAADFATPLFDMEPLRAENLATLAKEKGLTVQVTAPFDREYGPNDLQVGSDFIQKAFALTPEYPFAGPIVGLDSVYVIALAKKLPSEIPALDQIRAQVVKDYEHDQAQALALKAGTDFDQTLTNELAQGKPFAAICLNAKLKPVSVPPVSLSTRDLSAVEDHVALNQYKQLAFTTPIGRPSPFQPTSDGGLIVYVKEKLPLDEAKMNSSLPAFANYVRQSRQSEAFNQWFQKEAEKGLRDTPLARASAPATMSSAPKAKKS
ncbi:MAG: SurA N-terminal domain-containing protein [Limisphaerales bacterium]